MEIIDQSSTELTRAQLYVLTRSQARQSLAKADVETIKLNAWCHYMDVNSNGNEVELLSLLDDNGSVYNTNSKYFIRDFMDMIDFFAEDGVHEISVIHQISKKNQREFITCSYLS